MSLDASFVHLNIHSEYSLIDGNVRIKDLIKRVKEQGGSAVAITDRMNLFALVKFYRAAVSSGIKPIIGVELNLRVPECKDPVLVTALCQNKLGYLHLTEIITHAYQHGQQADGTPVVDWNILESHAQGLIILSGAQQGDLGLCALDNKNDKNNDKIKSVVERWKKTFPDRYYVECRRCGQDKEEDYITAVMPIAKSEDLPLVATNAVRFLNKTEFAAHEARVCINAGWILDDEKRPKLYAEEQYLTTATDMQALFSDLPDALENANEIAKRCTVKLELGKNHLPQFPIPEGLTTDEFFRQESENGLNQRIEKLKIKNPDINTQEYTARLNLELDVIIQMGFPGYFLIVADFIRWGKNNGVPVGPGRGSGAGSLVAYSLGITDLDPIEYELLFERFLNPDRVSLPDFDVDFCMEGRDRVIEYVAQRYGKECVSQIITYGTMAARAVVRDVGRVQALPYGLVDGIAKLIPFEIGMTLNKALVAEEELKRRYDEEDEVKSLLDMALQLEGLSRNAGKHAGGVVIAPTKLTDFTPLYFEPGGTQAVTQFDKDDVEAVGLVKFDFLGLRTLTIIDWTLKKINKKRKEENLPNLDITDIKLDDKKVFELMDRCQTLAVFQLESRGMRDLIRRLKPDCFGEMIALVALFRPGPLQSGMVDDFIDRKHGRSPVKYLHASLETILKPTFGVILYQEQVMQIAQVLCGYTLGGADLLRRAMGKKKVEEMAKQRDVFVKGAKENNIDPDEASHIFDMIEKFAGYGFNKSHSAAYALLSYQTAWLKAHYPSEFMASVLSSDMDNTDKVVQMVEECKQMRIKVIPPNVNCSQYQFIVNDKGEIIFGLGAVKGVGRATIEAMIAAREQGGKFKNLLDLCERTNSRGLNKRAMEPLVRCGACDDLGPYRAALYASIERALKLADQTNREKERGQGSLFDGMFGSESEGNEIQFEVVECPRWTEKKRLTGEKETIGYYLSGHPISLYRKELSQWSTHPIAKLATRLEQKSMIAGIVVSVRVMNTKRGSRMAVLCLEDETGKTDVTVFSKLYDQVQDQLKSGAMLLLKGEVGRDDFSGGVRIVADKITDIETLRRCHAKRLYLHVKDEVMVARLLDDLPRVTAPFRPGNCQVVIRYENQEAKADLQLGDQWRVQPNNELIEALGPLCGSAVQIDYGRG